MKKVFAILLVLALVAGFVFADDVTGDGVAQIKVKAAIGELEPMFQLEATSGDIDAVKTDNGSNPTDYAYAVLNSVKATALSKSDTATASVLFTIYQISDAKMAKKGYTLAIDATNLILVDSASDLGLTETEYAALTDANKNFTVTQAAIVKNDNYSGANGTATITKESDSSVKVIYKGGLKADAGTGRAPMGTVTCTWTGNRQAFVGNYEATITLTITDAN